MNNDLQSLSPHETPGRLAYAIEHAGLTEELREMFRRSMFTVPGTEPDGKEDLDYIDLQAQTGLVTVIQKGFGGTVLSDPDGTYAMHENDGKDKRRMLGAYNPHGISVSPDPRYADIFLRRAIAIQAVIDESTEDEVQAVAQSAGVFPMAIAGILEGRRRRIRSMVLAAPPPPLSRTGLMTRFAFEKLIMNNLVKLSRWLQGDKEYRARRKVNGHETAMFMADRKRAWETVQAVTQTDLRPLLHELQTQYGVKIALLAYANDRLFTKRRIRRMADDAGIPNHRRYVAKGNHSAFSTYPKETAAAVMGALEDLDAQGRMM